MNTFFFRPSEEILKTRNRLPHWQQPGATYSLTFRMADSIPASLRDQWEDERAAWLKMHPEPWDDKTEREYHQRFTAAMQRWLDAGYGSCLLRRPDASALVAGALAFFDGDRYLNHSWVVMPNHVHVVVTLHAERILEDVLHSWKSYTSHQLAKRFPAAPNPFWQRDYFDRIVRDAEHFANCIRYVRQNPVKANLRDGQYRLYEKGAVASRHRISG